MGIASVSDRLAEGQALLNAEKTDRVWVQCVLQWSRDIVSTLLTDTNQKANRRAVADMLKTMHAAIMVAAVPGMERYEEILQKRIQQISSQRV